MSERENGKEEVLVGYGQTLASGHEHLAFESTSHIQNSTWIREIPKNVKALANGFATATRGGGQWQAYPVIPTL